MAKRPLKRERVSELQAAVEERIRYECLVGEMTSEALRRQPLSQFIDTVLRRLGEALDVSRVYLFKYDRARGLAVNTAEWLAEGVVPSFFASRELPVDEFPWLKKRLLSGKDASIDDCRNAFDEKVRSLVEIEGTRALLCLPIEVFAMPYGFMGFDECRGPREWKAEDINLLRSVCRVVAQAIEKGRWVTELVKTERLAAMGRLAGAIAHEINNPLQSMLLHLDLLKPSIEGDEEAMRHLGHMEDGIRRISDIVWRVLNLHREKVEPEDIDANDLLRGALELLEKPLERVNCISELHLEEPLPVIRGVKQLLHQAVLNIIVNAMESIGARGTLLVSSRKSEEGVVLTIRDNGAGISKEHLPHIFEPFYSSKVPARSGLGLFIAHMIVSDQGGRITVESREGEGTAVSVWLPGPEMLEASEESLS